MPLTVTHWSRRVNSERHIPGAAWAIVAVVTLAVLALLAAGGLFDDHRSQASRAMQEMTQRIYSEAARTPRP